MSTQDTVNFQLFTKKQKNFLPRAPTWQTLRFFEITKKYEFHIYSGSNWAESNLSTPIFWISKLPIKLPSKFTYIILLVGKNRKLKLVTSFGDNLMVFVTMLQGPCNKGQCIFINFIQTWSSFVFNIKLTPWQYDTVA